MNNFTAKKITLKKTNHACVPAAVSARLYGRGVRLSEDKNNQDKIDKTCPGYQPGKQHEGGAGRLLLTQVGGS